MCYARTIGIVVLRKRTAKIPSLRSTPGGPARVHRSEAVLPEEHIVRLENQYPAMSKMQATTAQGSFSVQT